MVDQPEAKYFPAEKKHKAFGLVKLNVFARFKAGDRILYSEALGVSKTTYYDWLKFAAEEGLIEARDGGYWRKKP
jgi:hypothetical protein